MRKLFILLSGAALGVLLAAGFLLVSRQSDSRTPSESSEDPSGPTGPGLTAQESGWNSSAEKSVPVPRLVTTEKQQVVSDPTSPDYDPWKLSQIGNETAAIYQAEPRVEGWAQPMETMLTERIAADLGFFSERSKISSIECRTSSCLVTVDAPNEDEEIVTVALQVARPGDVMQPSMSDEPVEKGWHRQQMHVLFSRENREVGRFSYVQVQRRRAILEFLKNDPKATAELGLDPERLPPFEQSVPTSVQPPAPK